MHNATRLFPVIHYRDDQLALNNANCCAEEGADGVFLISMDGNDGALASSAVQIMKALPMLKVGLNYLCLPPLRALNQAILAGVHMSWTDTHIVHSHGSDPTAAQVANVLSKHGNHEFFAAVSFKYQADEPDPPAAAAAAVAEGFIPTTSGPATGVAAPIDKLRGMRAAIGDARLAIASGISAENARDYMPYVTDFLVATGISSDFHTIDRAKLRQLVKILRE